MEDSIDLGWMKYSRIVDPKDFMILDKVGEQSLVSMDYSPYFGYTDQRCYISEDGKTIIFKNSISRGALKAYWPCYDTFEESRNVAFKLSESGIDVDVPYDFVGLCDGRERIMSDKWTEIISKITDDYSGSRHSELRLSIRRLEKEGVEISNVDNYQHSMDVYNKWKKRARDIDKDPNSSKFRERALKVIYACKNHKTSLVYYKGIPAMLAISEVCGKQIQGTVAYYDPFFITEFRQPYWLTVYLSMRNWMDGYKGRYFNHGDVCQWVKGSEGLEANALKNKTKFLDTVTMRRFHIPPRMVNLEYES